MQIVIPVLGFQKNGGYRVLSELASAWTKFGHKVKFICPVDSDPYYPTQGKIIYVNEFGEEVPKNTLPSNTTRLKLLKSLYFGLKNNSQSNDIVLANHALTSYPVMLMPKANRSKFYYIQAYEPEYYYNYGTLKGFIFSAFVAFTYHFSLHRIVNAPIYLKYKNLRAKHWVPPGVDRSIFKPPNLLIDPPGLNSAHPIKIGCIGRVEPEKGTIYVLKAFEQLVKKYSNVYIRIAAFGPLPENWTHEKLEIVVPKSDQELSDYYRSVDILIAPGTVQHGAPHYPVLEAGACGTIVVTTGYLGASDDTAWLVSNRDPEDIANAIVSALSNPDESRRRRTNFLKIIEDYEWEKVAVDFISIFSKS